VRGGHPDRLDAFIRGGAAVPDAAPLVRRRNADGDADRDTAV
jgi:hypothetical protein